MRPHPLISLAMFAAVFALLWVGRAEAADDPIGYSLMTLLLLGLTALGASQRDR